MSVAVTALTTASFDAATISLFSLVIILLLMLLTISKEISYILSNLQFSQLNQALNISIVPLTMLFMATVTLKIAALLS